MTALFVALILTFGMSLWLVSSHSPLQILDSPNERSLHEHPTPRTGGVAILISLVLAWCLLAMDSQLPIEILWIAGAVSLVAGISFLDDLKEQSPLLRITVHGLAAALLVAGGGLSLDGFSGMIITWLAIIWMLNLYNFMDGMDGFAGGMAVCGFTFLGIAGWLHGNETYAYYAWAIAAASCGFLLLNFPPARIFMGDAGSATLGLIAAAFSLWGFNNGSFPLWYPLLVFSPFIVDATVTLIRRAIRGEKVWQAHRTHYYQRLVQAGWSHRKTVLVEYGLMLTTGVSAWLMLVTGNVLIGLVLWTVGYMLLAYVVDAFVRKNATMSKLDL